MSFLKQLTHNPSLHSVAICRTIIKEVQSNLTLKDSHIFFEFINAFAAIDEDFLIPFELGDKYESKGLKHADAFIAAYAEWTGAEILVSENRHFLSRHRDLPFRVLTAEKCLGLIRHL